VQPKQTPQQSSAASHSFRLASAATMAGIIIAEAGFSDPRIQRCLSPSHHPNLPL
jgi:hypothetical protein